MSPVAVRRRFLALLLAGAMALGLASRLVPCGVWLWDRSLGDALYAVAMFLAMALVAPRARTTRVAAAAFGMCAAIELFQLTEIPDRLARAHTWIGWILGREFAVHDLVCYAVGVAAVALVTRPRRSATPRAP